MMKYLSYSAFAILIVFNSCNKEAEPVEAEAPIIAVLSINPDTVVQFTDSVILQIRYEDMNGDLGSPDPDINDLEIKDSRLSGPDTYHIQPLAPAGYSLFINGTLRIKLNTLFLLGNGNSETAVFKVKLKDQAGNWSKEVSTDPVVIIR